MRHDARPRFRITPSSRPDVQAITVEGELDAPSATRLLRLIDTRLQLISAGYVPTRHLLIDLTATDEIHPQAATILTRAQETCRVHRTGFHLVGLATVPTLAAAARSRLSRCSSFPNLTTALNALP